jgi:hypothetical protein
MTKDEVIAQLCMITSDIGERVFKHALAHDCFCGANETPNPCFNFDRKILKFICDAIKEKIERERNNDPKKK